MKNSKTYYQIILDQSGSMGSCLDATISGFNEQLQLIQSMKEKYPEQTFLISLTTFNNEVTNVIQLADPAKAKLLSANTYRPSGMTALHDAIGLSIMNLKATVQQEVDRDEASVVVVVLTDGYENASTIFDGRKIKALIKELDQHKNWTFSYLGATPDAVKIAQELNFCSSNSASYKVQESKETWSRLRKSSERYIAKKQKGVVSKKFLQK